MAVNARCIEIARNRAKARMLYNSLLRSDWVALLALPLSAGGTLGGRFADHFTFEGDLPADFALRAQAHYHVRERHCAQLKSRRQITRTYDAEFKAEPHGYRFAIPVRYHVGVC